MAIAAGGLMVLASAVTAEPISDMTSQVSVDSYTYILQDLLYTHDGDDRGYGPEHDLARDNIQMMFESFDLETSLFGFTYSGQTYYNVVGVHRGLVRPDEIYIVGAHYDSVNNPGADDNASGTTCVIESARILSQYDFEATIIFIAFDREEQGMIGSNAYATEHRNDDIRGMVNTDMIAYNPNQANLVSTYGRSQSDPLKTALTDSFGRYANGVTTVPEGVMDRSDHAPFEWQGFQAVCVIERYFDSNPNYHTQRDSVDTPNYLDYEFATNVTRGVVGYLATSAVLADLVLADPEPGLAGVVNDFRVGGATPFETVYYAYGFTEGSTGIGPCPGVSVDIANPVLAGNAAADAAGDAVLSRMVHEAASGRLVLIQAVEPGSCMVSNRAAYRFE